MAHYVLLMPFPIFPLHHTYRHRPEFEAVVTTLDRLLKACNLESQLSETNPSRPPAMLAQRSLSIRWRSDASNPMESLAVSDNVSASMSTPAERTLDLLEDLICGNEVRA